jgi:hypothetical protein
MRLACLSVFGLLGGLLGGCQDGLSVDATDDTFCDEFAEVACHNMYQCCSEAQIENELGVSEPRTEAQCREDKRRLCVRSTASLRDSLAAKRVAFNAEPLNSCLTALLAPDDTCSTYVAELPWTEACEGEVWTGLVAMGGNCFFDHDCAGAPKSAECGPDQKCVALPTAGFPCPGGTCAEGFFCGSGGTCQAQLAENAPCIDSSQCREDLFCDTTAMPMPICTAQKPGGQACTSDLGCISGDCVPGKCAVTNFSCYSDSQCAGRCADDNSSCSVGFDYMCNFSGTCNTVTSVTCSGSTADQQCVNAGAGTKCNFNVACVPGDCVGDPVCTAPLFLADFCSAGLGLTP